MLRLKNYIFNEFVKVARHKPIYLTGIVVQCISVLFALQYSASFAQHADFTLKDAISGVGGFFRFYGILIYPLTVLLFIWPVDLEEDANAFNWVRLGIVDAFRLKVAKFTVAYLGFFAQVSIGFLAFFFFYQNELSGLARLNSIQTIFFNNAYHFIFLSIPLSLTVFLSSFYIRKFYVSVALLLLFHLVGLFVFADWAIPFRAIHKTIGIETIIARNWNSYTKYAINQLYLTAAAYVLLLIALDCLVQTPFINRFFRNAF